MELTVEPREREAREGGLATLDGEAMDALGLESGEYVAIDGHGGEGAVAKAWLGAPGDAGREVVRLGAGLRRTIGVDVGDRVAIEPADVRPAERVTVALPRAPAVDGAHGLRFREGLLGRAVSEGRVLSVAFDADPGSEAGSKRAERHLPIRVLETDPTGTVVVREWTDVVVSETAADGIAADAGIDAEAEIGTGTGTGIAEGRSARSTAITYDDVGGLDDELERIRETIELPARYPELFDALGVASPDGVLLYGPPGTGKTLLARALANESAASVRLVSGPALLSEGYGGAGDRLGEVFEEATENEPAIVVVDELDAIAAGREKGASVVERQVFARLLSALDGLEDRGRVTVVGTTDRPDALDPALRRPGRFDREIEIGVPDAAGRREILRVHAREMALAAEVDLDRLAERTHGFVGADLATLLEESALCALGRVRPELDLGTDGSGGIDPELLQSLSIGEEDVREALGEVEPSALRELFVEVPEVTWADVGGLDEPKARLQETVQWPLRYPEAFDRVALRPATGVLLYGPPGTGKTLLAKAVANEAQSNFVSIEGPELLDKYVGESERGVRELFAKARRNAPTIVFFDEIDAIAGERGQQAGDAGVGERVVSQLLTELDGLEELEDVVVVAASNRPGLIDDALVRPGRLDRHVHVSVPDEAARRGIFAVHTDERPLTEAVALDDLAARTEGYVGADIEAVCREAATVAVREFVGEIESGESARTEDIYLHPRHFDRALEAVPGSASGTERFGEFAPGGGSPEE